ncbi:MAG: MBL fold metallo-hydrolase [Spirochaetes bacterium]|nr:MBL fold metallo-hydrolase [Spirochaetota bacterium]
MKVCDGVYAYIWRGVFENNCNTFYFGEPFNMFIDPGLAKYVDMRFEDMKKDGIDTNSIEHVVATHSHPDHFEGCHQFMGKGPKVAMHKEEIKFLNEIGPQFFAMFGMAFPKFTFDIELEEGPWKIGNEVLHVYKTPGHSPGSVCLYWESKKVLVCGDLIFKESVGRTDFPGGNSRLLKESIQRMKQLDVEYLLPGHMDIVVGKNNIKKNFELIEKYIFPML